MTFKREMKWSPNEDQIDNIIIPAMQGTAKRYEETMKVSVCLLNITYEQS